MIESPVLIELLEETERVTRQFGILMVVEARFGDLPDDMAGQVLSIESLDHLKDLVRQAATCPDLDTFRAARP
jgi:hypothetical protein